MERNLRSMSQCGPGSLAKFSATLSELFSSNTTWPARLVRLSSASRRGKGGEIARLTCRVAAKGAVGRHPRRVCRSTPCHARECAFPAKPFDRLLDAFGKGRKVRQRGSPGKTAFTVATAALAIRLTRVRPAVVIVVYSPGLLDWPSRRYWLGFP